MVKRYSPDQVYGGMAEEDTGEWVSYDDYKAASSAPWKGMYESAEREVQRLNAEVRALDTRTSRTQRDNDRLRATLKTIAEADYRGNRSPLSSIAERALEDGL